MRLLVTASLLVLIGGCALEGEDSCGIATEEISVIATVVENGPTLRAEAEFATEGPAGARTLALCKDDNLTIAGAQAERVDRPDRVIYSHTSDSTATRSIVFALARDGETSVTFAVDVPPSFDVTAPESGAEISRSQAFSLTWSPPNPGGMMRIELAEEIGNGICLETQVADHDYKGLAGVDVDDDGDWNIPAAVIDSGARDKCEASYRFSRRQASTYPAEMLAGGYLDGRVERIVPFLSVP